MFKYVLSTMRVSKESISKFLIGNLILFQYGLRMNNLCEINFLEKFADRFLAYPPCGEYLLEKDMCKFESL